MRLFICFLVLMFASAMRAQQDAPILKVILDTYYKSEKVIYKNRNQLLFLYCEKPNNNEQLFETLNDLKLAKPVSDAIRREVATDTKPENWAADLAAIYASDNTTLKNKINDCLTLGQYQEIYQKRNLNNQRMMIISKPILYQKGTRALVKIVFYRSIEHNNGSVLLLEKIGANWQIKQYLNEWST